jgi:hypothetical protein
MTATDAWIVFGDSHMIPHEDIALCEGWPKGTHASVELFRCANVLPRRHGPRQDRETQSDGHREVCVRFLFVYGSTRLFSIAPLIQDIHATWIRAVHP